MRHGLIVDLFAGGGGASIGIEAAFGCPVDIAINHDPKAIAVHRANHPKTKHFTASVWEVDPVEACGGLPVRFLHASPDCTHFSRAKGSTPRKQHIRSLAEVVIVWAEKVRPLVITLENVPEFTTWGPLHAAPGQQHDGTPIKERAGEDFNAWCGKLRALGYGVEWRVLDASHFGAPTKRKRFFLVARCDGRPIRWPQPTHGPGLEPFHTAAECIDWALPCPSIFDRTKPLAPKTLRRIAAGIERYVLNDPRPFIVKVNHGGVGRDEKRVESIDAPLSTVTAARRGHAVVAPTLIQTGYGERPGQAPRVLNLHEPLGTLVGGQKHALVATFLAKHYGGVVGHEMGRPIGTVTAVDHHSLVASTLVKFRGTSDAHKGAASVREPLPTVTAGGGHFAEVRSFLTAYYGGGSVGQPLTAPLRTITTDDRFGLVTVAVDGVDYVITDIWHAHAAAARARPRAIRSLRFRLRRLRSRDEAHESEAARQQRLSRGRRSARRRESP